MSSGLVISPFFLAGAALGILGAILIVAGIVALLQLRPLRFTIRTLAGLIFLALGALAGTIALGIQGYQALTRENIAARISVRTAGPQRFEAAFHFPDGREAAFDIHTSWVTPDNFPGYVEQEVQFRLVSNIFQLLEFFLVYISMLRMIFLLYDQE